MKAIIVIAASVALLGVCSTAEDPKDKKTRILKFYNCLCNADDVAKEEYMMCSEKIPEKCMKIRKECSEKIIPGIISKEGGWNMFCKSEQDVKDQLYECVMKCEEKDVLDEEEKKQLWEFIKCARKLGKKICNHP